MQKKKRKKEKLKTCFVAIPDDFYFYRFDVSLYTAVGGEGDLRGEITTGGPFNTPLCTAI